MSSVTSEGKPAHALTSHIALTIKREKNGNTKLFTARVMADGHRQVYQREYDTVYALVISFTLCVLTLTLTFTLGWFFKHVDFIAALLSGEMERELLFQFCYNSPNCTLTETIY